MKQRIITGAIFGAIVLFLINYNMTTASIFLALVGMLSAYEYFEIVFTKILRTKAILYLVIQIILAFILIEDEGRTISHDTLLYISVFYMLFSLVTMYNKSPIFNHNQFALFHNALYITVPFVLLYKFMLTELLPFNEILLSILVFIWISDSAAYFVGSQIGKHKLFERISPGKTWEGSIGAGIITLIIAIITHFALPDHGLIYWVILSISILIFGTYGDLYESSIKRQYKVKDSGTLLPGHGGFLDRFDSFIFVIPIVLLLWKFLL